MSEWIKLAERKPEFGRWVLTCNELGEMAKAVAMERPDYVNGTYWIYSTDDSVFHYEIEPLYWMPYPEPPEELKQFLMKAECDTIRNVCGTLKVKRTAEYLPF